MAIRQISVTGITYEDFRVATNSINWTPGIMYKQGLQDKLVANNIQPDSDYRIDWPPGIMYKLCLHGQIGRQE